MKITISKEKDDRTKTFLHLSIELLMKKMKDETSTISKFRYDLHENPLNIARTKIAALPRLIPGAVYSVKNGIRTFLSYNGIVMLEVEDLSGPDEAEYLKGIVKELPQTYAAFIGISQKSLKIWVRFVYPDGSLPYKEEAAQLYHANAYRLAVKYYQPQLPLAVKLREPLLDSSCCRSADEYLYFNPEAMPIVMKQPSSMPQSMPLRRKRNTELSPIRRMAPGYDKFHAVSLLFEAAMHRATEDFDGSKYAGEEERNGALTIRIVEECFKAGLPINDTENRLSYHFYKDEHAMLVHETVRNVYDTCKGFGQKNSLTAEQELSLQLDRFMEDYYEFRYNAITSAVEYRERTYFNFYFRPLTKRTVASITMNALAQGLRVWDRDVIRYLSSDRVKEFHPIEEYFNGLPKWNGHDYIRELAHRVSCNDPNWENLFYRWFIGMVANWRGTDKKYANSTVPILVGKQGYRKSTFCRLLTPPCLQAYYTDHIDFGQKKDVDLALTHYLLINLDEFDQIGERQQAYLKHILQKPVVNTNRKYSSTPEEMRRYASFIGTSNNADLLSDPTGARRYICIEVTGKIDLSTPIDYDQLYAQAKETIHGGERYWFDEKEEALLQVSNESFQRVPPVEQLFQVYFRPAKEEEEGEWLLAADIVQQIQRKSKFRFSPGILYAFGRMLKRQGVTTSVHHKGTYYHVVKK